MHTTRPSSRSPGTGRTLSLRNRLLGSFIAVALLLVGVAALGINQLSVMNAQAEFLGGPVNAAMQYAGAAESNVLDLRRAVLNYTLGSPAIRAFETSRIAELHSEFAKVIAGYKAVASNEEEQTLLDRVESNYAELGRLSEPVLAAADSGDLALVGTLLEGEHKQVRRALYDDLKALIALDVELSESARAVAASTYLFARWVLIGASVLGLVLAIVLGLLVTRVILRQLGGDPTDAALAVKRIADGDLDTEVACNLNQTSLLRDMADLRQRLRGFYDAQLDMQRKHEAGELDFRIAAETYPGAFGRMAEAVNDVASGHIDVQQQVIAIMERYAIGDLAQDMPQLPGKKAAITAAMVATKRNLAGINDDIQRLVQAAADGDFSVRGDAETYQFAFRDMVDGLNRLMDTANNGLGEVGRVLQSLASGDLTQSVTGEYRGAFGSLADNTNRSIESLRGIVERISSAVGTINTAAREISSGNSDLSTRTESQAASLEETASSMEELTATVRGNAENTRNAAQLAREATEGARRGGAVVANVVATMQRITESSRRIGDIIGVIDGIAFQTNILALNAAVEAARAGEQGRGFAVVASEVRSLAQRSADAAKEIKGLIEGSARNVDEGAKLVEQAGGEINTLVDSVSRVTEIMRDITSATDEQRAGIEQVNETVTHLDQATQQNAALVEEASAAARSLEEQADGLQETVGQFRLDSAASVLRLQTPTRPALHSVSSRSVPAPSRQVRSSRASTPPRRLAAAAQSDADWNEF
jgi:methyl-accepting chemotaxis protein